jgi:hypothetical protein
MLVIHFKLLKKFQDFLAKVMAISFDNFEDFHITFRSIQTMSAYVLMMFVVFANLVMCQTSNVCENILSKEGINEDEFASAVAHITHSLYLESMRLIFTQY